VRFRDYETIIIGGMIRMVKHQRALEVPFLKKVPLLEAAFRNLSAYRTRSEFVVLLRPTVLPNEPHSLIP
jgi:type II secretory pathway component GspD/PulD (secretin)